MARKSKKTKSKAKKKKNTANLGDTTISLLLVTLGLVFTVMFLLPDVGIIGNGLKYFVLMLFSAFSFFIFMSCIVVGVYNLTSENKFSYANINKFDLVIFFLMCIFIYVFFNIQVMAENVNISFDTVNNIVSLAMNMQGTGMVPYLVAYIFYKMVGTAGIVLFITISFLYLLLKYKRNMVATAIGYAIGFMQGTRETIEVKKQEKREKQKSIKPKKGAILDESLIDEHFMDVSDIEYGKKKPKPLVNFDDDTDFEKYQKTITFSDDLRKDEKQIEVEESIEDIGNAEKIKRDEEDKIEFKDRIDALYEKYKKRSSQSGDIEKTQTHVVENVIENADKDIKNQSNVEQKTQTDNKLKAVNNIKDNSAEKSENNSKDKINSAEKYSNSSKDSDEDYYNVEYVADNCKDDEEEYVQEVKKPYVPPNLTLLSEYEKVPVYDRAEKIRKAQLLKQTLLSFGVEVNVENIAVGPTITRYEVKPKVGTKVSKITNLTEDLALALAAKSIRIEAPIPGKSYIGVEIPNETSQTVSFKETIQIGMDKKENYNIVFAMGKDISGEVILSDITKMPHALIAGSTGSGKSVCINTLICSIIYNYSPEEVKLILIDPKVVELSIYNKLPHLIIPVVTDMKKTPSALSWAVNEMEKRYALFAQSKSKDIVSYNKKNEEKLPRIVIIIDELADLMMVAPKEIEEAICRIAQKARACGIHLVVATQRPSVDVITGLIKANIPSRIAFAVSSQTDSRTILDMSGAEKLLGKGDMLYSPIGMNKPVRIQGAFLTEEEVEKITDFVQLNNYVEDLEQSQQEISKEIDEIVIASDKSGNSDDELYDKVVDFAYENEEISVSLVQRQFRIGYNRASRIVDDMEKNGIVGKSDGSKPRKVLKNYISE
jgi:DNA translocase ftsK